MLLHILIMVRTSTESKYKILILRITHYGSALRVVRVRHSLRKMQKKSRACYISNLNFFRLQTWRKFYYRISNLSNTAMDTSSPPVPEVFQERSQPQQSGTNAAREERLRRRRECERERRASESPERREARLV